jgi:hypothetical protein
MTIRSNGNSKIIGAAAAPMAALISMTCRPCDRLMRRMTTKITTMQVAVIGKMGVGGAP